MIFGFPSVTASPAPNRRHGDWPDGSSRFETSVGANHIFQARYSKYATPINLIAINTAPSVRATTARPATAQVSQSASPSHIAAKNGSTSRNPWVRTRATSAAILGPGDPAATISAKANTNRFETVIGISKNGCESRISPRHGQIDVARGVRFMKHALRGLHIVRGLGEENVRHEGLRVA